jgi:hypothetical protein
MNALLNRGLLFLLRLSVEPMRARFALRSGEKGTVKVATP